MTDEKKLDAREQALQQRLEKLRNMEDEIREKENALKLREKGKKQLVLRLSPTLWEEIARWADEDFRSINGQIEYLLTECVRARKKNELPNDCSATDDNRLVSEEYGRDHNEEKNKEYWNDSRAAGCTRGMFCCSDRHRLYGAAPTGVGYA